ncbi:MAG: hypothetical protein ACI80M_001368, partial [Gammaproteobacteria bacterium]
MFPEFVQQYFIEHQNLLWLVTLCLDLTFTVVIYRLFGR